MSKALSMSSDNVFVMSEISYSLIKTRPYKWRTIFFVEWDDCTTFVRAPLTQLTSIAGVSPEPADVGRLQGLPRVKSFYHFESIVKVYLIVGALDCLSWLAMVPVSIADAMSATTPLTEVSSLPGSSTGISHFFPWSFDTTTLCASRSIDTTTVFRIFLCRLAHRLGVLRGCYNYSLFIGFLPDSILFERECVWHLQVWFP